MNDYIFRFVTRTRYIDYKVYIHGGQDTISNREGFRPLRQKCSITEGEQCACVFVENAKIYLVVSALNCHKTDERGRAIRFSFCQIFTNKKQAVNAFIKITYHWENVENWLSKNLRTVNENTEKERVEFDEAAFMKWLVSDGEEFESDNWPKKGEVLKWTKHDGKADYIPIGKVFELVNVDDVDNSSDSKKKIIAGVAVALIGLIIGGCYIMGNKENVQNIKEAYNKKNNAFDDTKKLSEGIHEELQKQGRNFTQRDGKELFLYKNSHYF